MLLVVLLVHRHFHHGVRIGDRLVREIPARAFDADGKARNQQHGRSFRAEYWEPWTAVFCLIPSTFYFAEILVDPCIVGPHPAEILQECDSDSRRDKTPKVTWFVEVLFFGLRFRRGPQYVAYPLSP